MSPQARLLLAYSKVPLATLILRIPPMYVMSRDEHSFQSSATSPDAIPLKVRIMGSLQPTVHDHTVCFNRAPASVAPIRPQHRDTASREIVFVAKDLCTLIHSRKGNVAKSIGVFAEWEKARMAVLCPRSNDSVSTHILTVVSMAGMYRLLNASRSPLAPVIMKVLYEVINGLLDEEERRRNAHSAEVEAEAFGAEAASAKSETAFARSEAPAPCAASRRGRKEYRGDEDEASQVSGPVIVYSLVSLSSGVSFVRLQSKDRMSVRQELRRLRQGVDGAQEADDEQTTIEVVERAHAAEVSRCEDRDASGASGAARHQGTSKRAAAARLTVAKAVAMPSGFGQPTLAAIPVQVFEEKESERSGQRLQERDERVTIEDVGRRSFDDNAGALQSNSSANTSPLTAPQLALVAPQVPVSTLQQLHQLQLQQLQCQQQQQQQRLMAHQQQQQQQHKRDEILLLMHQQQQQYQHCMPDAQRLPRSPFGGKPLPNPYMSPSRSPASSLYPPLSPVPLHSLSINLSATAADVMQPAQPTPHQPSASSASLSLQSSCPLGLSSFAFTPFPSPSSFVQPLGPSVRPPTMPPPPQPLSLIWPVLGLGGGSGARVGRESTGNRIGGTGISQGGCGGCGRSNDYNRGSSQFCGYGQQSRSDGFDGSGSYQQ